MVKDKSVLLVIKNLYFSYSKTKRQSWILRNINLAVKKGEILSIIGESGEGKSTLAKLITGLINPTMGTIFFGGIDLKYWDHKKFCKEVQYIFQNAKGSLDPKFKVKDIIEEGLKLHKVTDDIEKRIFELVSQVGLNKSILVKYPPELSGGEAQRVAIARALSVDPSLIIADEPASSLDIITKLYVLSKFKQLRSSYGKSIIYITHDIGDAALIADRIAVIHKGEIVEISTKEEIIKRPRHPQTKILIEASLLKL